MTEQSGISILSCGSSPDVQEITPEGLLAVLAELRNTFDFVVVDTSGAWSEVTAAVIDAASIRIFVTTPEPNSVKDTVRALGWLRDRLGDAAGRVHLVENRSGMSGALGEREFERQIGQVPSWRIADDPLVMKGMQVGIPVMELNSNAPGAKDLREFAISLLGRNRASAPPPSLPVVSVSAVQGIA
jgi:MinD-like ATPase involved in chromosome partitioning or flagellar assembly